MCVRENVASEEGHGLRAGYRRDLGMGFAGGERWGRCLSEAAA